MYYYETIKFNSSDEDSGRAMAMPFTEGVNLSGTYLIRDDRYWMNPWRDS
ncbi:hypothetical protein LL127_14640 [Clostridium estertheticum]|nr:hypothetical protein [Clostridium estertheticum]MCB2308463.1 hypothetical protein [Clostridium estertheticum]MCB2347228.1 hypothetical protein [Clostridium estertheticum]WAG44787.1 hypothetical protein LL127_14640 [Clostridium estertheticum]